jgi:hypothetical protein
MSHDGMSHDGKLRDELVHQADAVRDRLIHTVSLLDQRRHEALDLRYQLRRHVKRVVAMGFLVVLATAGAVVLVTHRISTAAARRRRDRWRLARTIWRDPARALRAERGPIHEEALRGVAVSLVTMILTTPARSVVRELLATAAAVTRPAPRSSANGKPQHRRLPGPEPA